ncbi:hypothetical protein VM1G_02510 [Cytospora mali]|uniref:Uncharacterized protein n=1 Tax=Cytospora mali TaxID=578113 RepID=A0A194VPQ7_CYTMA|nr:hypothetical protein VM1G_02510 [Valsa mali]
MLEQLSRVEDSVAGRVKQAEDSVDWMVEWLSRDQALVGWKLERSSMARDISAEQLQQQISSIDNRHTELLSGRIDLDGGREKMLKVEASQQASGRHGILESIEGS